MRIVRPQNSRKSGAGAKPNSETESLKKTKSNAEKGTEKTPESSGLKTEPDDFVRERVKAKKQFSKSQPKNSGFVDAKHSALCLVTASNLKSVADQPTQSEQFRDGRKRRRSEFSELNFFSVKTDVSKKLEPNSENVEALSDDDLAELFEPQDDKKKEFNRLLASGMRLLAMREHSVKEVTTKLLAKTELPDIAYSVVDQLLEDKYLSDERFVESFVRSRMNKGFGPVKIRSELQNKGITNHLIAEYLDMNSASWFDIAREQYDKKYGELSVNSYNDWTKRARFLQSRGFTMEHIQVTLPHREFN